jgi:hypothetical protein
MAQAVEPVGVSRYDGPLSYWLYDHPHETIPDLQAELDYWRAHIWSAYYTLLDNYKRMRMEPPDRRNKLNFAIACLSNDLAVLQAHHTVDRGLRGELAMQTFRDEAVELLEEVTSSWRAACERLVVTFENEAKEEKNLTQPFNRVRDDFRRFINEMPAPGDCGGPTLAAPQVNRSKKRLPATVASPIAARRMEVYMESKGVGQTEFDSSGNELTSMNTSPEVPGKNRDGADWRAAIDAFIFKLAEAGREITRKDIWIAAGYKDATEFERFQRSDPRTTRSAAAAFNRVLALQPTSFIELLDKKSIAK